jgi:hypothetical protein
MNTTDPVELIVATALTKAGMAFTHESDNKRQSLDFHLVDLTLISSANQYASKRTAAQMRSSQRDCDPGTQGGRMFRQDDIRS